VVGIRALDPERDDVRPRLHSPARDAGSYRGGVEAERRFG